ncbi:TonB-dependent receptor domain-containing protein [Aurantiacibacter flavus]|uniref:TonB-dependent receptor n=1 Tax=Aurantiacibacter flavus TaxID=3145232 RepID=A0ABV0CZJ0_9SPHN
MKRSYRIRRRNVLAMASGLAIASATLPTAVAAQQAAAEGTNIPSENAIVVTGSRIARDTFKTATPVTVVSADTIQDQAAINVADALNDLPSFRPQATPATTAIFIGNAGANLADLRGLGAQRTLVLVNGRRYVPGTVAGSGNSPGFTVDLNMIPTALIARSEVVTGGASAAYGSDAVAGVVNLILDNDLVGLRASAQYGISDRGDNEQYFLSGAFGTDFDGGRGHFIIGGEFADSDGLGDCYTREWCAEGYGPVANPIPQVNGLPRQNILPNVRPSTASYNGLFNTGPFAGNEILPDGTLVPHDYGTYYGAPIFQSGGSIDPTHAFYAEFPLVSAVQRYNVLARASYEVSDAIKPFVEATYAKIEGETTGAQSRNLGLSPTDIGIAADNAFLPENLRQQLDTAGVDSVRFGRIGNDLGHSRGTVEREAYRIAAGAEGEFGGGFTWDMYYQYGQTDYSQRGYNTRKNREFFWAVDAVDEGEFNGGAANGNIICRQVALGNPAAAGCLPLNLFGENNFDPAARDYAYGTVMQDTKLSRQVLAANISGDLFELPGGPLGFAVGAEYRVEDADGTADPDSVANNFYTSPGAAISGPAVKVKEGYIELAAPLLSGVAGAELLELNGAVRVTDYSTSGTEWTWKIGGTWEPLEGVRFRLTRSRDIRAPNFFELNNPSVASFQFLVDPENEQAGSSLVSVRLSGNPGLKPESADTLTAGVVLSPFDRFNLAVDYFDIKLSDVISTLGGETILRRCSEGATNLCELISRDGGGALLAINNTLLNLNELNTRGIDIEAGYSLPVGTGDLSFRALGTYVFDLITVDQAGEVNRAGQNGSPVSQESGLPDFTGRFIAEYETPKWEVGLEAEYISSGLYNTTQIGPDQVGYDPTLSGSISDNSIDEYLYVDMRFAYRPMTDRPELELFARIDNLFDRDPPNNIPSSYGVTNPILYDVVGRMYRMGVRFEY